MVPSGSLPPGAAPPCGNPTGTDAGKRDALLNLKNCVDSEELLRGRKTISILHNGLTYRLQATRLGKLILTK